MILVTIAAIALVAGIVTILAREGRRRLEDRSRVSRRQLARYREL